MSFPGGSVLRNLPANAGDATDTSLIPGAGRLPGEENGNPLQCSCLGSPMDRGLWWAQVHRIGKESDKAEQLNNNVHYLAEDGSHFFTLLDPQVIRFRNLAPTF